MNNSMNVGAHFINGSVHQDLSCPVPSALHFHAIQVTNDQVVRTHHALAYAGGRSKNATRRQANAYVSVISGYPTFLVSQTADLHDLAAKIVIVTMHVKDLILPKGLDGKSFVKLRLWGILVGKKTNVPELPGIHQHR